MTLPPLRHHQQFAMHALQDCWAEGRKRAWVELPPGAGKTRVGLETAGEMLAEGTVSRVVAFSPNTAIQSQWEHQGRAFGLDVGVDRVLDESLSALTYQALAVFDSQDESEVRITNKRATKLQPVLQRLHDNGRALVEELRAAGNILLILDECHHLLEVWGRLLGEILDLLPEARVLGLTATPPTTMTFGQAELVNALFGGVAFQASIPAVVRQGDLAPYLELAWFVTPTKREQDWLDESAERFLELTTALMDPKHGTVALLPWLDEKFCGPRADWVAVVRDAPELADAALRFHHAGLLQRPSGSWMHERHRHDPTAEDWATVIEGWMLECVVPSPASHDVALTEAVRRVLPSVGFTWTKQGIRRGRTPTDRVLARSAAKTVATVAIAESEQVNLGPGLRMLVLCDYEQSSATLPAVLEGVVERQTGSAYDVLVALTQGSETRDLPALLVTARTVAARPETLTGLREAIAQTDPRLAESLEIQESDDEGISRLTGPWTSRVWVRHVTAYFESGAAQVLLGTRALLGEGWDARTVNSLVDLTTVTSSTAVVQTRGRALRVNPDDPDKVAVNWSVTCVAEGHPRGGNDYDRLVAKHRGYFGLDLDGHVVDGVSHLDQSLSPYTHPAPADFDALNARMIMRSQERFTAKERWRVGAPYADEIVHTLRIQPLDATAAEVIGSSEPPEVAIAGRRLVPREADRLRTRPEPRGTKRRQKNRYQLQVLGATYGTAATSGVALGLAVNGMAGITAAAVAMVVVPLGSMAVRPLVLRHTGRRLLRDARHRPGLHRLAAVVADALQEHGHSPHGAAHVETTAESDGSVSCLLQGVPERSSQMFAESMDELLGPLDFTSGMVGVAVLDREEFAHHELIDAAYGDVVPDLELWYAVPRSIRFPAMRRAWQEWVGGALMLRTSDPAAVEARARAGSVERDRFVTVLRQQWS